MGAVAYEEHYRTHLSRFYSWMFGDFEKAVSAQLDFFRQRSVGSTGGELALDLGSGPGFQSIALARLGYSVVAVDTSEELLGELRSRDEGVEVRRGDIRDLSFVRGRPVALVVCMGDTITHMDSLGEVRSVLDQARAVLRPCGRLVLTFRELSVPRRGADRFILVRGDADRVLTCFLEDDGAHVVVTDLLHERRGAEWTLTRSSYRKVKLTAEEVAAAASAAGFLVSVDTLASGMKVVLGTKG
jgi:SAM-dependent methyltransferase